jgi:hypothetical protein
MNRIRRIAVILAGPAAIVLAFSAAEPVLAAHVSPPRGDALQVGRARLQECPSAVTVQLRIGEAWDHRRKFGGPGPAVGGWRMLTKTDRYSNATGGISRCRYRGR